MTAINNTGEIAACKTSPVIDSSRALEHECARSHARRRTLVANAKRYARKSCTRFLTRLRTITHAIAIKGPTGLAERHGLDLQSDM
eukprot:855652-Pleurochrysis_carterae.AAC.2